MLQAIFDIRRPIKADFLDRSSMATPILASLLILGGLGLTVMVWAERA